jgi:hypothetical protein
MVDEKYVLIDQGIEACNELLLVLTGRMKLTTENVRDALGKDTDTGKMINIEDIAKIIGAGAGRRPVTFVALKKFFNRAIRKIHEKERHEKKDDGSKYNPTHKAIREYLHYCRSGIGASTIEIPNNDDISWVQKIEEVPVAKYPAGKIVDLLDLLDCSDQQNIFTTALQDNRHFYNCPVIAHGRI